MNLELLSLSELRALLSKVDNELANIDNEHNICNNIAKSFTGKQYPAPVMNKKIIADIAIQKDILEYLNNGGRIITANTTGRINSKAVKGAKAGAKLYRKYAV